MAIGAFDGGEVYLERVNVSVVGGVSSSATFDMAIGYSRQNSEDGDISIGSFTFDFDQVNASLLLGRVDADQLVLTGSGYVKAAMLQAGVKELDASSFTGDIDLWMGVFDQPVLSDAEIEAGSVIGDDFSDFAYTILKPGLGENQLYFATGEMDIIEGGDGLELSEGTFMAAITDESQSVGVELGNNSVSESEVLDALTEALSGEGVDVAYINLANLITSDGVGGADWWAVAYDGDSEVGINNLVFVQSATLLDNDFIYVPPVL